jgi:hypothetical protein
MWLTLAVTREGDEHSEGILSVDTEILLAIDYWQSEEFDAQVAVGELSVGDSLTEIVE